MFPFSVFVFVLIACHFWLFLPFFACQKIRSFVGASKWNIFPRHRNWLCETKRYDTFGKEIRRRRRCRTEKLSKCIGPFGMDMVLLWTACNQTIEAARDRVKNQWTSLIFMAQNLFVWWTTKKEKKREGNSNEEAYCCWSIPNIWLHLSSQIEMHFSFSAENQSLCHGNSVLRSQAHTHIVI